MKDTGILLFLCSILTTHELFTGIFVPLYAIRFVFVLFNFGRLFKLLNSLKGNILACGPLSVLYSTIVPLVGDAIFHPTTNVIKSF